MLFESCLGTCKRAAVLLCAAVLACCLCPAAAAAAAQPAAEAPAEAGAPAPKHAHKRVKQPTTANLVSIATSTRPATYRYVCACGKTYSKTYSCGPTLTKSLDVLKKRYRRCPEGGIAFFGSSYLSNWTSAPADLEDAFGFPANMVYNYAVGGSGIKLWKSSAYLDLVASKKPSVVVIHGINNLRFYPAHPDSLTDEQAVQLNIAALQEYVAGLEQRLPNAKIVLVSAFKTPAEYISEGAYGSSCRNWQRIDLYNGELRALAASDAQLSLIDLEPYLLCEDTDLWGNRQVRFYTNPSQLCDEGSLASARILAIRSSYLARPCPYFRADLHHASKLAYVSIWLPVVGEAVVNAAASSEGRDNLIINDSTSLVTHL